ncbi:hypothetical protein D1Y84_16775 [Acidipila sp. EB88]|nr:hypothetical protein D1Y84_16775 [Acidipila sp. EB88]
MPLLMVGGFFLLHSVAKAQQTPTSISDGLSSPVGDTDLGEGTQIPSVTFTGNAEHSNVNDPTHSQLEGSQLSATALSSATVSPYVDATPNIGVLTDAQSTMDRGGGGGGLRNPLFSNQPSTMSAFAARPQLLGSAARDPRSPDDPSDLGNIYARQRLPDYGTNQAFSGVGVVVPTTPSGVGYSSLYPTSGSTVTQDVYFLSDPVISGIDNGYQVHPVVTSDTFAEPSSQVATTFAMNSGDATNFQFDDGQSPSLQPPLHVGEVQRSSLEPAYVSSPTGFPDSTRGMAGSPLEATYAHSPLEPSASPSISPFAPVSGGSFYGQRYSFQPSLHKASSILATNDLWTAEREARRDSITNGTSIMDNLERERQSTREAENRAAGRRHRKTLQELDTPNQQQAYPRQLLPPPKIR